MTVVHRIISRISVKSRFGAVMFLMAFAVAAFAQKQTEPPPVTLSPEQAAKEGKALAAEIVAQKPTENSTNTGVMTIRAKKSTKIAVRFEIYTTPTNWISSYSTVSPDRDHYASLTITHNGPRSSRYTVPNVNRPPTDTNEIHELTAAQLYFPFAGSDFCFADLGLEFFHWPEQRLIKKEMRRSMFCNVLESVNPKPPAGSYSRVLCWIDNESGGIVFAQAFDASGKLLKEFIPKKVKKIEGQWQLQEMEIDNVQTDSRTIIDFDLTAKQSS